MVSCLSIMDHSTLSIEGLILVHDLKYLLMSTVKMKQAEVGSAHNVLFQFSAITFQIPDHRFHSFFVCKIWGTCSEILHRAFLSHYPLFIGIVGFGLPHGRPIAPHKIPDHVRTKACGGCGCTLGSVSWLDKGPSPLTLHKMREHLCVS